MLGEQLVCKDNGCLEALVTHQPLESRRMAALVGVGLPHHGDCDDIHPVHRHVVRPRDNFADSQPNDDDDENELENVDLRLEFGVEPATLKERFGAHDGGGVRMPVVVSDAARGRMYASGGARLGYRTKRKRERSMSRRLHLYRTNYGG